MTDYAEKYRLEAELNEANSYHFPYGASEMIIQITATRGGNDTPVLYALTNLGHVLVNDAPHAGNGFWYLVPEPKELELKSEDVDF